MTESANRKKEYDTRETREEQNDDETSGYQPVPGDILQHVDGKYISHQTHGEDTGSEH